METIVEKPTKNDQRVARKSLDSITKITGSLKGDTVGVEISGDGSVHLELPTKVFKLLRVILANMAEGKSISLIPSETELSTQQAADILGVSRPHLVKLLESGKIPFKKVGKHRRMLLEDLIKYLRVFQLEREKALQELADQAQELDMGY
ncbi:MAG: helix-turn-helix domain-containing protein [Saprospiraceae bacterium]